MSTLFCTSPAKGGDAAPSQERQTAYSRLNLRWRNDPDAIPLPRNGDCSSVYWLKICLGRLRQIHNYPSFVVPLTNREINSFQFKQTQSG